MVTGTHLLNEGGEKYEVEKVIPHADYDGEDIINDIALMQLKSNITYGPDVKPINLPAENTGSDTKLVLSGWGTTAVRRTNRRTLKTVAIFQTKPKLCPSETALFLVFLLSAAVPRKNTQQTAGDLPEIDRERPVQEDPRRPCG